MFDNDAPKDDYVMVGEKNRNTFDDAEEENIVTKTTSTLEAGESTTANTIQRLSSAEQTAHDSEEKISDNMYKEKEIENESIVKVDDKAGNAIGLIAVEAATAELIQGSESEERTVFEAEKETSEELYQQQQSEQETPVKSDKEEESDSADSPLDADVAAIIGAPPRMKMQSTGMGRGDDSEEHEEFVEQSEDDEPEFYPGLKKSENLADKKVRESQNQIVDTLTGSLSQENLDHDIARKEESDSADSILDAEVAAIIGAPPRMRMQSTGMGGGDDSEEHEEFVEQSEDDEPEFYPGLKQSENKSYQEDQEFIQNQMDDRLTGSFSQENRDHEVAQKEEIDLEKITFQSPLTNTLKEGPNIERIPVQSEQEIKSLELSWTKDEVMEEQGPNSTKDEVMEEHSPNTSETSEKRRGKHPKKDKSFATSKKGRFDNYVKQIHGMNRIAMQASDILKAKSMKNGLEADVGRDSKKLRTYTDEEYDDSCDSQKKRLIKASKNTVIKPIINARQERFVMCYIFTFIIIMFYFPYYQYITKSDFAFSAGQIVNNSALSTTLKKEVVPDQKLAPTNEAVGEEDCQQSCFTSVQKPWKILCETDVCSLCQECEIIDSVESSSDLAWLISFPNSGTEYTMDLTRKITELSSGTNYPTNDMSPIYPQGPFWHTGGRNFAKDQRVLTGTHCGPYCDMNCGPRDYIMRDPKTFEKLCRTVTHVESGKNEVYSIHPKHVVHLIRHPLDNIVSRFHYHFDQFSRSSQTSFTEKFPRTREGFQLYCQNNLGYYYGSETANYERGEQKMFPGEIRALFEDVPCYSDFYRYVQWHDNALKMHHIFEHKYILTFYEDYQKHYNHTVRRTMGFLGFNITDEKLSEQEERFTGGKQYHDYYTDDQKTKIWTLIKRISSEEFWSILQTQYKIGVV